MQLRVLQVEAAGQVVLQSVLIAGLCRFGSLQFALDLLNS